MSIEDRMNNIHITSDAGMVGNSRTNEAKLSAPASAPLYIQLKESVDRLDSVTTEIQYIINDLRGHDSAVDPSSPTVEPYSTFMSVMETSPQAIHSFCDETFDKLKTLRQMLLA